MGLILEARSPSSKKLLTTRSESRVMIYRQRLKASGRHGLGQDEVEDEDCLLDERSQMRQVMTLYTLFT